MSLHTRLAAVLFAAATLPAACAHIHPPPPLALSGGDSGKSVEMTVGQTLTVTLPSDPATGYRWQLATEPDGRTLIVVDSGFDRPVTTSRPSSSASAGTEKTINPGQAWWKLRATGEGSTSFAVRYVRPWEPEADARQFTITVEVKAAAKSG